VVAVLPPFVDHEIGLLNTWEWLRLEGEVNDEGFDGIVFRVVSLLPSVSVVYTCPASSFQQAGFLDVVE